MSRSLKNTEKTGLGLGLSGFFPRRFQLIEPGVQEGVLQGDALLGVVLEEAVDQVPRVDGNGNGAGIAVLPGHRVLQNLGNAVVVEGQRTSQPASPDKYM
jgi:hypothetical protein